MNDVIYLDNNSTTRVDDRVLSVMLPYFTQQYANTGSSHLFGLTAKEDLEIAQQQVADLISASSAEIIFTSGATESVNLALKGLANNTRKHIVTVSTEHKSVLDTCTYMQREGFHVTCLDVNKSGLIDLEELKAAVTDETLLVCIMFANNETGVIQPIAKIAQITHSKGALFLCDATQAVGKIPVDVNSLSIDLMAFSAHKFYGPKGIGALYISTKIQRMLLPEIHGGGQQRSKRSGTLNVPGIIGFAKACETAYTDMQKDTQRIKILRDKLESGLLKVEGSYLNGLNSERLPNTTNICFPGVNSEKLIIGLKIIAVSSGSACSALSTQPSHVLKAMGLSNSDALASIRFSLGRFTTEEEINTAINKVTELVYNLRHSLS